MDEIAKEYFDISCSNNHFDTSHIDGSNGDYTKERREIVENTPKEELLDFLKEGNAQ